MINRVTLEKIKSTIEVAVVNTTAINISLNSVEQWMRLASIGIAIAYTLWKWNKDVNKNK